MNQTGKVTAVNGGHIDVVISRKTACDSCSSCEMKGGCHSSFMLLENSNEIKISAKNLAGAELGDIVEISSSSGKILSMTALVFVLPVIIAIATYFIGQQFLTDFYSYLATFFVLLVSFLVFSFVLNRTSAKSMQIDAVKIIEKGPEQHHSGNV
jgi:Positive regulator of sigma E activity